MDTNLTKRRVRDLLRVPGSDKPATDADLARFFDTSHAAIWQWKEDGAIPAARQWELRARRPDLFADDSAAA